MQAIYVPLAKPTAGKSKSKSQKLKEDLVIRGIKMLIYNSDKHQFFSNGTNEICRKYI